jgi:hypothetical protein
VFAQTLKYFVCATQYFIRPDGQASAMVSQLVEQGCRDTLGVPTSLLEVPEPPFRLRQPGDDVVQDNAKDIFVTPADGAGPLLVTT